MGLVLDTCVFIQAERKDTDFDFKRWNKEDDIYISTITVSELLMGVHNANTESRRLKRSAFVEAIISGISVLDFTSEAARIHAELYVSLSKKGNIIGSHDLIIAATALSQGYSILTSNHEEFNRIPGLNVFSFNDLI